MYTNHSSSVFFNLDFHLSTFGVDYFVHVFNMFVSLPSHENRFMELMDKFGGSCPTPKMHTFHKEHYQTFLEMFQSQFHLKSRKIVSNPTYFGVCTKGCSYAFFSKADRERHMRLMKH